MKKLILFLTLVLSIALLVTALAVTASADDVCYAVWDSEEDYLANPYSPRVTYSTNSFVPASIAGGGYILCYTDMYLSKDVQVLNNTTTVLNLNGHTMTTTKAITVGEYVGRAPCSYTVMNGTIIHQTGQFFKPQGNSSTYLINLYIQENSTSGGFIYGDSFKNFVIRDSVMVVNSNVKKLIDINPPAKDKAKQLKAYEPETDAEKPYTINLVFDNSVLLNLKPQTPFIKYRDVKDTVANLTISFLSGSSFDKLDSNFIEYDALYESTLEIYIEKGAKFATKNVPIEKLNPNADVYFYDSAELVGNYIELGNITELAYDGYVAGDTEKPMLIWGYSGDAEYPHALCFETYDVEWYVDENTKIDVDYHGYDGYADGLVLDMALEDRGYHMENDPVRGELYYKTVHAGWAPSPASDTFTKSVTVNADGKYYAIFTDVGPATAVKFSGTQCTEDQVILGSLESGLPASFFSDAACVKLYSDVEIMGDSGATIVSDLVIDLNGYTLSREIPFKSSTAVFSVNAPVTVKNGDIKVSHTSLATVNSSITFNKINATYSSNPLVDLVSGNAYVNESSLTQLSEDKEVPAFLMSKMGGASSLAIEAVSVSVSGPIAAYASQLANADIAVSVSGCDSVSAYSVFTLYQDTAERVGDGVSVTVDVTDCRIVSEKVLDVPKRYDGTPTANAVLNVDASYFTADPMDVECGRVVCPLGYSVLAIADDVYKYTVAPSDLSIKFNLVLQNNFTANFYIPKEYNAVAFTTYLGKTGVSELGTATVDGKECYKASLTGISLADCLDDITVSVSFRDGNGEVYTASFVYTLTDYFEELLLSGDALTRRLVASAIRYIEAAYCYASSPVPREFSELIHSEAYARELRDLKEVPAPSSKYDAGNIDLAFGTAQLYLASELYVRFNLKESFTGTLTVNGETYNVSGGMTSGKNYIVASVNAFDLYRTAIEISGTSANGETISGEYSLADYILGANEGSEELLDMLTAFFAYCYEANVYMNRGVIPPYIESLPPIDVTYR